MEKRLLLAVLLMSAALLITNLLFPPPPPAEKAEGGSQKAAPAAIAAPAVRLPPAETTARTDTVVVTSPLYRYAFSTRGAALVQAELLEHESYTIEGPVQLVPPAVGDFLAHRVAVASDTLDLRALPFQTDQRRVEVRDGGEAEEVRFAYASQGFGVEIVYTFRPDRYGAEVRGRITGVPGGATLLTSLGTGPMLHEAPKQHAERELAVLAHTPDGVEKLPMHKLERTDSLVGPLAWAAVKDKYFLAALITGERTGFARVDARRMAPLRVAFSADADSVEIPRAQVVAALPLGEGGSFAYDVYVGPQEHGRLSAIGYDLDEVIPYGYAFLRPVMRPIAAAILSLLDYLHVTLGWGYGWVLVLFGVMMKLVTWPLNAKAMRAQMKNAAFQPMLQELKEKHKNDPQKQQQEMVRLMKEEGVNPLAGCLPMLIPFPVLIALFFVFQGTIAFRGVEFLWLPDLSLPDPWYLLPLALIASTFALQWISMKLSGMEQNPQMKMMMYIMPLFMGIIFFQLPAGLNLYYTSSNIAGVPQQVLIARERRRAQEEAKKAKEAEKPAPVGAGSGKGGSGGGGKGGAKRSKRRG